MNHLKSFNENILTDKQLSDLEDICLELKDIGYSVYILQRGESYLVKIYKIGRQPDETYSRIFLRTTYYKWSEIKDTVERIMYYVKLQGLNFECEEDSRLHLTGKVYEIRIS